jgi:phosphoglycolate phosphatase-like HAD superfamily hydrolase
LSLLNLILLLFFTSRNSGYTRFEATKKNLEPENILMVGDGLHDMESGNAAGAVTCLIKHEWNAKAVGKADFVIQKLDEIIPILEEDCQIGV